MSAAKLTAAQRDMLERFAAATFGEMFVRPVGRRTYAVLKGHGFVEPLHYSGWGRITPAGREIVAPLPAKHSFSVPSSSGAGA